MSCILVGNGSSLLEKPNGHLIDSFDNVIRFNRFKTIGYEQYSGKKITEWYINAALKDAEYVTDVIHDIEPMKITLFTWTETEQNCNEYKEMFLSSGLQHSIDFVDCNLLVEMSEYSQTTYKTWSTGAIAIWKMLKNFNNVTLTGFDWWLNLPKHHYCDSMKFLPNVHQPSEEKIFLDKLQSEGRLDYLN